MQSKLEESLQNMEELTLKMAEEKEREKQQTKLVGFHERPNVLYSGKWT